MACLVLAINAFYYQQYVALNLVRSCLRTIPRRLQVNRFPKKIDASVEPNQISFLSAKSGGNYSWQFPQPRQNQLRPRAF